MTKRELKSRMGSDEFTEWLVYHQFEPLGHEREDFRSVAETYRICQMWSTKKLDAAGFELPFGFVKPDPRAPKMTGDQMKAKLKAFHHMNQAMRQGSKPKQSSKKQPISPADLQEAMRDVINGKHTNT